MGDILLNAYIAIMAVFLAYCVWGVIWHSLAIREWDKSIRLLKDDIAAIESAVTLDQWLALQPTLAANKVTEQQHQAVAKRRSAIAVRPWLLLADNENENEKVEV